MYSDLVRNEAGFKSFPFTKNDFKSSTVSVVFPSGFIGLGSFDSFSIISIKVEAKF